jgi:predicted nucleic acid-binding protein
MNKVFLDTSYAVALSAATDENHQRAIELAEELETSGVTFVMKDHALTDALTADHHFRQAGFKILL